MTGRQLITQVRVPAGSYAIDFSAHPFTGGTALRVGALETP